MKRLFAGIFVLLQAASAAPFTNLYFFGDSLSDTGNIYRATTLLNTLTLGLVPVTPQSPPYSGGRFSNGPVWAETTAARFGLASDAQSAGMSLGILGSQTGPGRNYAIGGARTGTGGALGAFDSLVPTGVQAQVNFYLSRAGGTADPNALYFLLGGGNDLRDLAQLTDLAAMGAGAGTAAANLAQSFAVLYQAGARNFAMINGPNIGLIPESINGGRIESGNYASTFFNAYLDVYAGFIDDFPNINLLRFDLFSLYNDVVIDTVQGGAKYGFTSYQPCIAPGPGVPSCSDTLFFDDIHPTTRLHTLFGNAIADQFLGSSLRLSTLADPQDIAAQNPEPATLVMLASGLGLVLFARRRWATRSPLSPSAPTPRAANRQAPNSPA